MRMDKKLETLREAYKSVPIPKELDDVIEKALQQKPKTVKKKRLYIWPASIAAAAALFIGTVNVSPQAAHAMSKIPVVDKIVEIVTFTEVKEERHHASIDTKTPSISGLKNKNLENSLNSKYVAESKKLYEKFASSDAAKADDKGYYSVDSTYQVMTNTDTILSVQRTIQETQASGYIQKRFDTIDKKNEVFITLKSLFKNDQYVDVISQNIIQQMKHQMETEPGKMYFITDEDMDPFKKIKPDQSFYITKDHKLMISFDEYEVAPGVMGPVEFEIPTKILKNVLVGDRYIR